MNFAKLEKFATTFFKKATQIKITPNKTEVATALRIIQAWPGSNNLFIPYYNANVQNIIVGPIQGAVGFVQAVPALQPEPPKEIHVDSDKIQSSAGGKPTRQTVLAIAETIAHEWGHIKNHKLFSQSKNPNPQNATTPPPQDPTGGIQGGEGAADSVAQQFISWMNGPGQNTVENILRGANL